MVSKGLVAILTIFFILALTIEETSAKNVNVSIPSGVSSPGCEVNNSCFIPSSSSIFVDDEVYWTNSDIAAHTVTSGDPTSGSSGKFDSGIFAAGKTFSHKFDEAGTFSYFCQVHPWMTGVVTVQSAKQTCQIDINPPPKPILLLPQNGAVTSDTTPTFDWTDVTDDCGRITYAIEYNWNVVFDQAGDLGSINGLTASTYTQPNPWSDHTKYWRVHAIDTAGNKAYSNAFKLTILSPPEQPSKLLPDLIFKKETFSITDLKGKMVEPLENEQISFQIELSNNGNTATTYNWWYRLEDGNGAFLYAPSTIFSTKEIAAGDVIILRSEILGVYQAGKYEVLLMADVANKIAEQDETNNSLRIDVEIQPKKNSTNGKEDSDGDGFTPGTGGDCNDGNATIFPGAPELDNGTDDDCDGTVDDGLDVDGDGIIDQKDSCPKIPEDKDGHDDFDGCPEEEPPIPWHFVIPPVVGGIVLVLNNIPFSPGTPAIPPNSSVSVRIGTVRVDVKR